MYSTYWNLDSWWFLVHSSCFELIMILDQWQRGLSHSKGTFKHSPSCFLKSPLLSSPQSNSLITRYQQQWWWCCNTCRLLFCGRRTAPMRLPSRTNGPRTTDLISPQSPQFSTDDSHHSTCLWVLVQNYLAGYHSYKRMIKKHKP